MRRLSVIVVLILGAAAGRAHALCQEGKIAECFVGSQRGTRECVNGHWTACEVPNPPPPPAVLKAPYVSARTPTSVTVQWNGTVPSGENYRLQHWAGAWVDLTRLYASGSFVHTGRQPDTMYCYRVVGTHTTGPSPTACGSTTETVARKAWRIQIELHTANVGDAGTDDTVDVVLNGWGNGIGSFTYLDYGRNDFERGDVFRYDLNLTNNVALFGDISGIQIRKSGGDNGWCVADFRLLVNERVVYDEDFRSLPSGCRWLDNPSDGGIPTYAVNRAQLRAHPMWQSYVEPQRVSLDIVQRTATLTIPREETESRVEAMIGHLIHGTQAGWGEEYGRGYVEADRGGPDRLKMDLDLKADALVDPEVDIDFDLRYQASCSADKTRALVDVTTENLQAHVDFGWFGTFLRVLFPCGVVGVDCVGMLENYIADRIEGSFTPIVQSQGQVLPPGYRCESAAVAIDDGANVDLVFRIGQ
jgi:hypothetical protein